MFRKHMPPVGTAPGVIAIHPDAVAPRVRIIEYDADRFEAHDGFSREAAIAGRDGDRICWIQVQGLGDPALLETLAEVFSLHPLVHGDIVDTPQRPKLDRYETCDVVIGRTLDLDDSRRLHMEQVTVVVGAGWLLTFEHWHTDVLEPVRERLRTSAGQIRSGGADYLAYALLDLLIDSAYPVLEGFGDLLDEMEDEILFQPDTALLSRLTGIRSDLVHIGRVMRPQREAFNALIRGDAARFGEESRRYLRDVNDHCAQVNDVVDAYRELTTGLVSLHLSMVSNRMNAVMKVLTIMSTVFIPLTFLAGIYGMNFKHIPELELSWAYPAFWGVSVAMAGAMLLLFRRLGWLGQRGHS